MAIIIIAKNLGIRAINMSKKNYYDILGVSKTASENDIKKAYRKLVRQYHPDVSDDPKADEKMGEINNAYETLKDKNKRAQYDMMLENPFMGQAGTGGFHGFSGQAPNMSQEELEEILRHFSGGAGFGQRQQRQTGEFNFEDILSTFGGGFSGTSHGKKSQSTKGEDQHAELSIDLTASYTGETRQFTISVPIHTVTGTSYRQKTIEVKIPKGIAEGQQIRLAGQGQPSLYGGEAGDLYLKIKFSHVNNIHVEGKDVFQTVDISPWEATLGANITIKTPAGKMSINIPKNSRTGTKLRLKEKGIPAKQAGDLFINLNIVLPKVETEAQRQAFEQLKYLFPEFNLNR